MTTETPTSPPAPVAEPHGGGASHRDVSLQYRQSHHVPSDAEYPVDEGLHAKAQEYLSPGLWRIYVYAKQTKDEVVNVITLNGVRDQLDMPANIDTEELERIILSVCYRDVKKRAERTHYMIRFKFKTAPGVRARQRDVTLTLEPLSNDRHNYEDEVYSGDRRDVELDRREERLRTGRWADPDRSSFQEAFSPFSDTSRDRRSASWRETFLRDLPERSRVDEQDNHRQERSYDEALATRRSQLFSPDMMLQFQPERMSSEGQRAYTEATLPYALINSSMGMSYQAFGAAFDMVTSGAREQARLHALQMQVTIDREKELMKLPLKFLEIEASNKGHQAEILHESQRNYLEALRMRGDMAQRELGYERQNMQSEYQLAESGRQLAEQYDKHQREDGDTFRRDLIRGLGPMALQGLGLFLDYFGQQKLGAAAKMSGSVVDGIMQNIENRGSQSAEAAPSAATPPPPTAAAQPSASRVVETDGRVEGERRAQTVPRRSVRILDVATPDEIQMQPLRSLCRMADSSISDGDRARVQQILSPQEWGQLEGALRAASDQECMQGLGMVMFTIGQDQERYGRMMGAFSPGQREMLNMIGDVMQGKIQVVDPNYAVQLRPQVTRMRTVVQQGTGGRPPPPMPPPDLDGEGGAQAEQDTSPEPPPTTGVHGATVESTPPDAAEDAPRPTIRRPDETHPTVDELAAQLSAMRDELRKMQEESIGRNVPVEGELVDSKPVKAGKNGPRGAAKKTRAKAPKKRTKKR